jgi:hypothetical protein
MNGPQDMGGFTGFGPVSFPKRMSPSGMRHGKRAPSRWPSPWA